MRESVFVSELIRSFKRQNCWAYKIADMPHYPGSHTFFDIAKPFDVFCITSGSLAIPIECKMLKTWSAFSLSKMRPSQIKTADQLNRLGYEPETHIKTARDRQAKGDVTEPTKAQQEADLEFARAHLAEREAVFTAGELQEQTLRRPRREHDWIS